MLPNDDNLFEKNRLLNVEDILFSSSSMCENIEIIVFVIRNGDVILYGLPINQHHPVVRWLPWCDDINKKICALALEPNGGDWALVACADNSIYLIPVLSLLGFTVSNTSSCYSWLKHDVTELKSPLSCENDFIPSSIAWFVATEQEISNRHVAVIGSTMGHIIVFTLISSNILFRTKIQGRTTSIEVCNRLQHIYIIISNEVGCQWRIILSKIENEPKEDNTSDTSDERVNAIELRSVTTEKDIKQWKMKLRQRNKKPTPLSVECGIEEVINCDPQWQLSVTIQKVLGTTVNAHMMSLSAINSSKVLTIEDFSSQTITVHKLPEKCGLLSITKSLIIFANVSLNHIKIMSRFLSSRKDESSRNVLQVEFVEESVLQEYIYEENEKLINIFCTDYLSDRCIVITNRAFYCLKLKTDPHKLVLKYILNKDNLQAAEKISSVFNLDLQKLICEAGDFQLSKGLIKEAVQLYNLTRSGGAHLILMLAVLGHMPELHEALRTCHYSSAYKLHFMNLKLLVSLHQFITLCSPDLRNEFKDLLIQNGYDEALAINVLARSGLCAELMFLTKIKGLHPITMNVVISIVHHYQLVNISHCKGFWFLISDQSFCDTLLMKPQFLIFHHKLVQKNLPHLNIEIIHKLEELYNPFSVPLRTWITDLSQGDVPIHYWIQTYILICIHLSARERKFSIDTIGRISVGQDWNFYNPKLGVYEKKISAGFSHAIAIIDGNAYSWGATSYCCLGTGPTTRLVSGPAFIDKFYNIGVTAISVSCGRNHSLAITENGVVGQKITNVHCGLLLGAGITMKCSLLRKEKMAAENSTLRIYSWGNNKYGQLGIGDIIQSSYPALIESLSNCNIIQIVAGQYHSIALDEKNRVFTWGWGVHGQLGHGDTEDCYFPKQISSLSKEKIIWCAAGQSHSLFLSEQGIVWACGSNAFGQLGIGKNKKSSIPIEVLGLAENIKMISVGYFHNFAISFDGEIYTWGCSPNWLKTAAHSAKRKMKGSCEEKKDNNSLEESFEYLTPKKIDFSFLKGKILKIVAGNEHNAILTEDGTIYTWGKNMDGQLGIKTSSVAERRSQNILIPTPISLGYKASDVACGYDFTIAKDVKGNIWTWGANHYSMGNKNALASLEGEIVIVNNKNRVIKLPHNASNVQPLPTMLKIPTEQKLIRKDLKPLLPMVLKTNNWRYRMHYTLEKLERFYNKPEFISECLSIGETDASAKLLQVSGNLSSALKITLKSVIQQPQAQSLLKSIISYYFSTSFLQPEAYSDFLIEVIAFWNEEKLQISQLEEIFYTLWKVIAIPLGDIFFRIDSKFSHLSMHFSSKFKLRLVEYMVTHKSNNIDCIFEGCSNVKEVLAALNKANDFVDITIDQNDSSVKTVVFKECSKSSNNSDYKSSGK